MEDIQQILQKNSRLNQLLQLKDEQLERQQQRILYLERQLYGRRSEKRLPSMDEAQLGLFDIMQGEPILEEETAEMT